MPIRKALITAANPRQRTLPLQTLIDQQGESKSALQIVLEEAAGAGIERAPRVLRRNKFHAFLGCRPHKRVQCAV